MKFLSVLMFIFFSSNIIGQVHNRMFKFNVGYSAEQSVIKNLVKTYNDTSIVGQFNMNSVLPVFSVSEDFAVNSRLSFSGTLGYQYFDIDYNNTNIGSHVLFASVNPQLSLFYRPGFEYYVKFRVGAIYRSGNRSDLTRSVSELLPQQFGFFTGLTLAGINIFPHEKWGINAEFSIWSPERVSLGMTYRFFKGELPEGVPLDEYYME
jgi:hypothetical protein